MSAAEMLSCIRVELVFLGLIMLIKASGSTSMGAVVNVMPLNQEGQEVVAQYSIIAPLPCPSLLQGVCDGADCKAHVVTSPLHGLYPTPGWCLRQWQNIVPSNYTSNLHLGTTVMEVLPLWARQSVHPETQKVNLPPSSALLPPLRINRLCSQSFYLSVRDEDGDQVRCRAAKAELGECHSCSLPEFLQLNEEGCVLFYNGEGQTGQYEVELMVEDFPKSWLNNNTLNRIALSSIPLHLSLTVAGGSTDCKAIPVFTGLTPPDGAWFTVLPFEEINITVTVHSVSELVSEIAVVGPPGLWVSTLKRDTGTDSLASVNITWVRTPNQLPHLLPVCFTANTISFQSEARCVWIEQTSMDTLPLGTVLQCGNKEMNLILPVTSIHGVPLADLQLNHPSCPIFYNKTHVMAQISLTGCGTKIVHSGPELVYTNILRNVRPLSAISRLPSLILPVACRFPGVLIRGNSYRITVPTEVEIFGTVSFWLEFHKPGEGPRVKRTLLSARQGSAQSSVRVTSRQDTLDLYVFSNCTMVRAELMVQRCIASETPGFETTYPILDNGCVIDNGTLEVLSQTSTAKVYRLQLQSLKTKGNMMYVECTVHLCITTKLSQSCSNTCGATKQQTVVEELLTHDYTIRSDPILLIEAPSTNTTTITAATTPTSHAPGNDSIMAMTVAIGLIQTLLKHLSLH